MTSLALTSSICTPRKTMRSLRSFEYGSMPYSPRLVRSMMFGRTYRPWGLGNGCVFLMVTVRSSADRAGARHLGRALDDVVDEPVLLGLLRREPAVPVGVLVDLLEGLAGVVGDALLQHPPGVHHLLGLDRDVGRRTADAARGLVHHDPRVRQGVALALCAGAEQELPHAGREPHRDRRDVVGHVLHRVVDGHAGRDRTTRRVDVEVDVTLVVLRREQQQLRADEVGDRVLDDAAEEDDALAQQPVVDALVEGRGARTGGTQGRDDQLAHRTLLEFVSVEKPALGPT